jgi:signal transduction histidine kinase
VLGEPLPIRGDGVRVPDETAVEVSEAGELLGALSVAMPANDPMTPAKERLVRDLASQAGLVLRNVSLVEELRAAHRRLVTAQDQERRRLERNIHDGAQQQLVALSVKTRLARDLTPRDPAKAAEMLTQIDGEIQSALEDLRDFARGIYPPLLADKGLQAALDAQARRSAVPISVRADGWSATRPRWRPPSTSRAWRRCRTWPSTPRRARPRDDRTVQRRPTFEVEDDGRGFDTASTRFGTGLQGIADRLSALHGELAIRSEPGTGTRVRGRIDVAA